MLRNDYEGSLELLHAFMRVVGGIPRIAAYGSRTLIQSDRRRGGKFKSARLDSRPTGWPAGLRAASRRPYGRARAAPPAEGRPAGGVRGGGAPPAPSSRITTTLLQLFFTTSKTLTTLTTLLILFFSTLIRRAGRPAYIQNSKLFKFFQLFK